MGSCESCESADLESVDDGASVVNALADDTLVEAIICRLQGSLVHTLAA